jgi:hypothetical protein
MHELLTCIFLTQIGSQAMKHENSDVSKKVSSEDRTGAKPSSSYASACETKVRRVVRQQKRPDRNDCHGHGSSRDSSPISARRDMSKKMTYIRSPTL